MKSRSVFIAVMVSVLMVIGLSSNVVASEQAISLTAADGMGLELTDLKDTKNMHLRGACFW